MSHATPYSGNNRLLAALPPEDFIRFFSALEPLALPLRQTVQDAAQPIDHVFFVEEGVCSVLNIMTDGSTIEVGMIGNEGMVGVSALLGDSGGGAFYTCDCTNTRSGAADVRGAMRACFRRECSRA